MIRNMRCIQFQHTPGPWAVRIDYDKRDLGHRIGVETGADSPWCKHVCRITPVIEGSTKRFAEEDMTPCESRLADARLIAEAPLMLQLLLEEASETGGSEWDKKIWAMVERIQPNGLTKDRLSKQTEFT